MTWFGTVVSVMGWKSIRSGVHLIKPPKIPLRVTTAVCSQQEQHHDRYCFLNTTTAKETLPVPLSSSLASSLIASCTAMTPSHDTATPAPAGTISSRTDCNNVISNRCGIIRNIWTMRGGDDKQWKFRGGSGTTAASVETSLTDQELGNSSSSSSSSSSGSNKQQPQTSAHYPASVCTAQGFRSYMEDEYFLSVDGGFAAVFDGHGGQAVSRYLRKNLYANVQAFLPVVVTTTNTDTEKDDDKEEEQWVEKIPLDDADDLSKQQSRSGPSVEDYENALESALDKVDREVQRISHWSYQGSTAVAIWIHEEPKRVDNNESTNDDDDHDNVEVVVGDSGGKGDDNSNADENKNDETNGVEASAKKGDGKETSNSDGDETISKDVSNEASSVTIQQQQQQQRTIIAANVGDSRAVLCRNGSAWELTRDHKPNDPLEKSRIEALGGEVVWCGDTNGKGEPILDRGIYRVNGNLALSRAIGDRSERPHVTAEPEILTVPIQEGEDEFILLATDGLWDVMDSNEAVEFVLSLQQNGHNRKKIATIVVEEALQRGTYDNITVLIIWLDRKNNRI